MWEPPKNLPPALLEAAEKIEELVYWQTWRFGELGESKRSERLEAIVLVLKVLVFRSDLVSGRIGRPPKEGDEWFRGISADFIARWTGMRDGRVERALDDVRWAGYVTSLQPRELNEETGEYRGLAAVRNITPKFWTRLQFKNKWDSARNDACARTRVERAQVRERTRRIRRTRERAAAKVARLAQGATAAPETTNQKLYELMAELRKHYPLETLPQLKERALKLM